MQAELRIIFGVAAFSLLASSALAADTGVKSGSARLTLNPIVSEAGTPHERWQVQAQDVTGSATLQGTVRVGGMPIERPDRVGKVDWQLRGTEFSGTVSSPGGGAVIGWFKGTVGENGTQGTFTTVTGQSGSRA